MPWPAGIFEKKLLTAAPLPGIITLLWRCNSVGQSSRFIPDLSLVRIQSPLPSKKPEKSGFFHILLRSFASILCPFFGVDPLFDPFMHFLYFKKPLNFYA